MLETPCRDHTYHRKCTINWSYPPNTATISRITERVEAFVGVPNKRQAQGALVARTLQARFRLRAQLRRVVDLWDLVDREVLRVDVAGQFRFEGSADFPEAVPLHAVEEGVGFQLCGALVAAEAVVVVADETGEMLASLDVGLWITYLRMKCSASGPSC